MAGRTSGEIMGGSVGPEGPPGQSGPPGMDGQDADDFSGFWIPGPRGEQGPQGIPGSGGSGQPSPFWVPGDDIDEPFVIPGPKGDTGAQGAPGPGGGGSGQPSFWLPGEDDDPYGLPILAPDQRTPASLFLIDTGASWSASAAATSIFNAAPTAYWVNIGDRWIIEAYGDWTNNTGAAQAFAFALKIGAVTLISGTTATITTNANPHLWVLRFVVMKQTSTIMTAWGNVFISGATAGTADSPQALTTIFAGHVSGALSFSPATLDVTWAMSTATAGGSVDCTGITVDRLVGANP